MTAKEAAKVIGCSSQQVRHLIKVGKIRAEKYEIPGGFYYDISQKEVERYRDIEQRGGWPRGQSYKWV
jgi:excisionase family DNA binding protein